MGLLLLDSDGSLYVDGGIAEDIAFGPPTMWSGPVTYSMAEGDTHFTRIGNSQATILFSEHPLFAVETITVGSPRDAELEDSDSLVFGTRTVGSLGSFNQETESSQGDGFYDVNLDVTVDHTDGVESIIVRPQLTMQSPLSATHAFHHARTEFRLPVIGNLVDCMILTGSTSNGEVYRWEELPPDFQIKYGHPGISYRGGEQADSVDNPTGDSGTNTATEPSGENRPNRTTFSSCLAIWNAITGVGCVFRSTDTAGRGKILSAYWDSSAQELVIGCRFVPIDSSIGTGGNSDDNFSDYGFEIRPYLSPDPETGWYDAIVYDRDRRVAASDPEYSKGRISQRGNGGISPPGYTSYPDRVRNMAIFASVTKSDLVGYTPELWLDNFEAIAAKTRVPTNRILCLIYGHYSGAIGDDPPHNPYQPEVPSVLSAAYDRGFTTLLYSIAISPSVLSGGTGLSPGMGIYGDLPVDHLGNLIIGETPIVGGDSGGLVYGTPFFGNQANTIEYLQFIVDQLRDDNAGGVVRFHGVYDDAGNAFGPPPNDDPTLNPEDRGFGSKTWTQANRDRFNLTRDVLAASGIDDPPIVMSEWPSHAGYVDLFFDETVRAQEHATNFLARRVNATAILYSEYCRIVDIYNFGEGPLPLYDAYAAPGEYSRAELFNGLYALRFHDHQPLSLIKFFENGLNYWFDPDSESDVQYQRWWTFVYNLFIKNERVVSHYATTRKVRELPTSYIRRQLQVLMSGNTSPLLMDHHRISSSARYDPDNDVFAAFITNASSQDDNPVTYHLDDTLTPDKWPELGTDPRDVYSWNFSTDTISALPSYDGISYTLDIDVEPGDVILLEFVPSGSPSSGQIYGPRILEEAGDIAEDTVFGSPKINAHSGPTWYVNNARGDDEFDGSFGFPMASLATAVAAAATGDTIVVQLGSGTYDLSGGLTISKSLKILGQGHDFPRDLGLTVTQMPVIRSSFETVSANWTLDSGDFSGGTIYYYSGASVNPFTVFDDLIPGIDKRARRVSSSSNLGTGCMWWDSTNSRVYYIVATDFTPSPISGPSSYTNPGSVGVRVPKIATTIDIQSDKVTIENFKFSEWGQGLIKVGDPTSASVSRRKSISITNTLYSQGMGPAIRASALRSNFNRNRFRYVGQPAHDGSYYAIEVSGLNRGAISLVKSAGCVVRDNDMEEIGGCGILLDRGAGDNLITRNRISKLYLGSGYGAITVIDKHTSFDYQNSNDLIVRNKLEHCSLGVAIDSCDHVVVSKNTFYSCQQNVRLSAGLGSGLQFPSSTWVAGNIYSETGVYSPTGSGTWYDLLASLDLDGSQINECHVEFSGDLSTGNKAALRTVHFFSNIYHRSSGSPRFRWGSIYGTLDSWQSLSFNYDMDSVSGSPGLRGASSGDFGLDEGSAARSGLSGLSQFLNPDQASVNFLNQSLDLGDGLLDIGAVDFEQCDFQEEDVKIFLTGNNQAMDTVPNVLPEASLGGIDNDTTFAYPVESLSIFSHLAEDLEEGISHFRAVDLANIGMQPSASIAGGGTLLTNFNGSTGVLQRPDISVGDTVSESTSLSIALDYSSPTETSANDQTDPGLTFETNPTESPESNWNPKVSSVDPGTLRLWMKRTVSPGAGSMNEDGGTLSISGRVSSPGVE